MIDELKNLILETIDNTNLTAIEKLNNYEIKPNQWFDEKHNLIEDCGDLEKNGTIDENGNLWVKPTNIPIIKPLENKNVL